MASFRQRSQNEFLKNSNDLFNNGFSLQSKRGLFSNLLSFGLPVFFFVILVCGIIGKEAVVGWLQGFVIGIIPGLGQLSIIVAVLTWIIMLFL